MRKITPDIAEFICTEHAKNTSTLKISKLLKEKGISLNQKSVWDFLNNPSNFDTINKHVDRWRADPMTVDMAHKKVRLHDLNELRKDILKQIAHYRTDDGIQEKKVGKYLSLAKRLIEIELAGREEIERKPEFLAYWEKVGPYSDLSVEELLKTKDRLEKQYLERTQRLVVGGPAPQGSDPSGEGIKN